MREEASTWEGGRVVFECASRNASGRVRSALLCLASIVGGLEGVQLSESIPNEWTPAPFVVARSALNNRLAE